MKSRVIVADDHEIVLEGIKSLLERRGFEVAGLALNGRDAARLAQDLLPDLAILDAHMPVMNGLEAAREIARVSPGTRMVLITMSEGSEYVLQALRVGFKGFVLKNKAATLLLDALNEVRQGHTYLPPTVSAAVVDALLSGNVDSADPLTARERQVLQLIGEGKSTKELATVLGISTKTAESHRTNLMRKLEIHEIAGLVRHSVRLGLVQV